MSGSKAGKLVQLLTEIITGGKPWTAVVGFAVLVLGLAGLAFKPVKAGWIAFRAVFPVFAAAFAAVYLLSFSSSTPVIRYLYILYMLIPVLWVAAFSWIKPAAVRVPATAAFLVLFFLAGSGRTAVAHYDSVRDHDRDLAAVTAAMEKTGQKYWRGHYWISYLLNSVTDERIVVASTTVERYPAYPLLLDTETGASNHVFLRDTPEQVKNAEEFVGLLRQTGKSYGLSEAGPWLLVHGIRGQVFPKNIYFPPDAPIPAFDLEGAEPGRHGVVLRFKARSPLAMAACRLHAVIPGFCDRSVPLPEGERYTMSFPIRNGQKLTVPLLSGLPGCCSSRRPTEASAKIDLSRPRTGGPQTSSRSRGSARRRPPRPLAVVGARSLAPDQPPARPARAGRPCPLLGLQFRRPLLAREVRPDRRDRRRRPPSPDGSSLRRPQHDRDRGG